MLADGRRDEVFTGILQAAQLLRRRDVADLVLLGDVGQVRARSDALGLDLGDTPIVDPVHAHDRRAYAERYHRLRSHRGITGDQAWDAMANVSYFGTMMVETGAVDGMVSGAAHTPYLPPRARSSRWLTNVAPCSNFRYHREVRAPRRAAVGVALGWAGQLAADTATVSSSSHRLRVRAGSMRMGGPCVADTVIDRR